MAGFVYDGKTISFPASLASGDLDEEYAQQLFKYGYEVGSNAGGDEAELKRFLAGANYSDEEEAVFTKGFKRFKP